MTNKNSRTKNSALSLMTGIGCQITTDVLRFVNRTVFIYTLGKSFLGINGLFADIMIMLSLTELGFGTAIVYRLYKPLAENDTQRLRVLLKFYKKAYQLIGLIILLAGLCLLPFLGSIIKDYDSLAAIGLNAKVIYILFLSQCVCTYFFNAHRTSLLSADQKQYVVNTTNIICEIICCAAQISILVLLKNFILYLIVSVSTGIIKNLINAYIAKRQYPNCFITEEENLSKAEVSSMLKDCGALFVYRLNGVVQKSTGNIIISAFIGLATVALYSNYLIIYSSIRMLSNQIFTSIRGSMGNIYATTNLKTRYFFFELANYATVLIFGTMAIIFMVSVNDFILFWIGDEYLIPQPFPILFGIEIFICGMDSFLSQIRNVSGLFKQMWMRPVFCMLLNLATTLILVQYIDVYAIPLGCIISFSLTNLLVDPIVIHKYEFKGEKDIRLYFVKNFMYLSLLILLALLLFGICSFFNFNNHLASFICKVFICLAIAPSVILISYRNTEVVEYLFNRFFEIIKKRKLCKQ